MPENTQNTGKRKLKKINYTFQESRNPIRTSENTRIKKKKIQQTTEHTTISKIILKRNGNLLQESKNP